MMEYALPEDADAEDEANWPLSMPSIGLVPGPTWSGIRGDLAVMPPGTRDREYHNRWDLDGGRSVLDAAKWALGATTIPPRDDASLWVAASVDADSRNGCVVAASLVGGCRMTSWLWS